jgi:glycosyltransferase involved in cell wall biosynthesis
MIRLIIFFLCFVSLSFAEEPHSKKQTICLNMIVKNESAVITRCLDSVKDLIDYWVILDTGSTDGTQEMIKKHMKGIPGKLYERPWKNFGESRSEAYNLAKGKADYILFMDADDILKFEKGFHFPELTNDHYYIWRGDDAHSYLKTQLVKGDLDWRWVGVVHEYIDLGQPYSSGILENIRYVSGSDGASWSDPEKFLKYVQMLKEGLKNEPGNVRYTFYMGESYREAGESGKALEWYQKRVDLGGWEEEVFWSKLQIAHMLKRLNMPNSLVIEAYKLAQDYRPHRPEATYYLAELYNQIGDFKAAYDCLKARDSIPKPAQKDGLFNSDWIADYGLLFQRSLAAYYIGRYQESLDACDQLLKIQNLPEDWRALAEKNRTYPLDQLKRPISS